MIRFLNYVNNFDKIWHLFLANFIIAAILVMFSYGNWFHTFGQYLVALTWSYSICFTQWVGNVYIIQKVTEKFPWENHSIKTALFQILGIILYSPIAFSIVQLFFMSIVYDELPKNTSHIIFRSSIIALIISFVISLIFTTIGFLKNWKTSIIRAESYKNQMLNYKYESLQNQINPHFLFNSFNVLSDLVYEDQKKAVDFIKKMSQLFRYVLDSREKELINAKEELEFAKTFTSLLQTRFENKLNLNFDISFNEKEFLVPMTMQLLIENCIKHNEISMLNPLKVEISRTENKLIVSNNYQPKNAGPDSKKLGLKNIQQQYSYFTNHQIVIENNSETFTVKVPILTKE